MARYFRFLAGDAGGELNAVGASPPNAVPKKRVFYTILRELKRSWTYKRCVWRHIYGVNTGYSHWFTYCATLKVGFSRSCYISPLLIAPVQPFRSHIGLALLTVALAYFPCLAETSLSKRDYENAKLLYGIWRLENQFLYCHVCIYICDLTTLKLDLRNLLESFTFPQYIRLCGGGRRTAFTYALLPNIRLTQGPFITTSASRISHWAFNSPTAQDGTTYPRNLSKHLHQTTAIS